jgi:Protein of unknown function (DUF4058)
MPSPFTGMNPYLESPDLWAEIHHRLISAIAIRLGGILRPKYRVAIEKRVYYSEGDQAVDVGIPDVALLVPVRISQEVRNTAGTALLEPETEGATVTLPMSEERQEGYLEIREVATGRVVTSIEVLSPTNKRAGNGRNAYIAKRQKVLSSQTHLIEIDLLKAGKPMDLLDAPPRSDYCILVSRSDQRPQATLHGFNLNQPIPVIYIPLEAEDQEPPLDLNQILNEIYDQAGFDLTIDYSQPPQSPGAKN